MDARNGFASLYVLIVSNFTISFILVLNISNHSINTMIKGKELLYAEIYTINAIKKAYDEEKEPYLDEFEYNGYSIIVDIDKENINISYMKKDHTQFANCQYDKDNKYIINYEYE